MLIYGVKVFKHLSSSKHSHIRIFYILEDDFDYLQWLSPKKTYTKTRLDLKTVKVITDNPNFDSIIQKKYENFKNISKLLFISHGDYFQNKLMIIMFESEVAKKLFWQGMQFLSKKAIEKISYIGDPRKSLALKLFIEADKDGNKSLSFEEVKIILKRLHINIRHNFLQNFFQKYDKNMNKKIDWDEFKEMVNDISLKPELKTVFTKYCKETRLLKQKDENF